MEPSPSLEALIDAWMELAQNQKLLCIDYVEQIATSEIGMARMTARSMAAVAKNMWAISTQLAPLLAKRG